MTRMAEALGSNPTVGNILPLDFILFSCDCEEFTETIESISMLENSIVKVAFPQVNFLAKMGIKLAILIPVKFISKFFAHK